MRRWLYYGRLWQAYSNFSCNGYTMAILQQAYSSFSTITMAGVQELLLLTQHQTVSLLPLPLVSALAAAARRNAALALLLRVRARVRVKGER